MTQGNPILQNYRWRILYPCIWMLIILIQAGVVYGFNPIAFWLALADAAVFNLLFACGALVLWYPVRFGSWTAKNRYNNIATYSLLAGILVTGWMFAGHQIMSLFYLNISYLLFLKTSTGWRIIEGLLFYTIIILSYSQYVHHACLSEEIQSLRQTLEKQAGALKRVAVKDRREIHVIPIEEIDYLEACGDYVRLHTAKGVFFKENTMKFFEEKLPSLQFIRIHRSFIVNVHQVAKIELYEKESYRLYLKNGKTLKASGAGYKLLKQAIQ
ncbi:MAG: LytTR family transcriptional regulator DNA-binding domain-containing protein [Bacteroidales bacterium]|nr:LytTR family transcriptional regulator DNA-binding domain-containing protein [Bacteroidales bacterium]